MDEQSLIERLKGILQNAKDPGTKKELQELIAHIEAGAYLPPLVEKKQDTSSFFPFTRT